MKLDLRGQVSIFVIIALLLVGSIIIVGILISKKEPKAEVHECETNSNCIPLECCHPKSCVSKMEKPDCSGISCTLNCEPKTLDCGQGSCKCIENKCKAVFN